MRYLIYRITERLWPLGSPLMWWWRAESRWGREYLSEVRYMAYYAGRVELWVKRRTYRVEIGGMAISWHHRPSKKELEAQQRLGEALTKLVEEGRL